MWLSLYVDVFNSCPGKAAAKASFCDDPVAIMSCILWKPRIMSTAYRNGHPELRGPRGVQGREGEGEDTTAGRLGPASSVPASENVRIVEVGVLSKGSKAPLPSGPLDSSSAASSTRDAHIGESSAVADGPAEGPGDDRAELTACDLPEPLGVDQSSLESAGVANLDDEGGPDHCLVVVGVVKGEDDRELEPDNSEGKECIDDGENPGLLEAPLVLRDADPKADEAVRRLAGVRGKDNLRAM